MQKVPGAAPGTWFMQQQQQPQQQPPQQLQQQPQQMAQQQGMVPGTDINQVRLANSIDLISIYINNFQIVECFTTTTNAKHATEAHSAIAWWIKSTSKYRFHS